MIQVIYRRYSKKTGFDDGYQDIAYFPTWKAAMILTTMWNKSQWVYAIIEVNEVINDYEKLHPDVTHYQHLWS